MPPPLTHLRVFGSLCYAHNHNHRGDKFAAQSVKGVFIGYPHGQKGWRVLNRDKKILQLEMMSFVNQTFRMHQTLPSLQCRKHHLRLLQRLRMSLRNLHVRPDPGRLGRGRCLTSLSPYPDRTSKNFALYLKYRPLARANSDLSSRLP